MIESVSLGLSVLALAVSAGTFWYTSLRRGTVRMTQPTLVGLGFRENDSKNQVFVRCMLFATGKRNSVVENIYARVRRGERSQNFSIWVHGEPRAMDRGAGLMVSEDGITKNFHFLLRNDEPEFEITTGQYDIEIFATLLNKTSEISLARIAIEVTPELLTADTGIQFDWAPDSGRYVGHVAKRSTPLLSQDSILKLLAGSAESRASEK